MSDTPVEKIKRRGWFPKAETSYAEAIQSVESDLRENHDILEIDAVEASTTLGGDEWIVTVEAVIEAAPMEEL